MGKGLTTVGLIAGLTLGGATEAQAEQNNTQQINPESSSVLLVAQSESVKERTRILLEMQKYGLQCDYDGDGIIDEIELEMCKDEIDTKASEERTEQKWDEIWDNVDRIKALGQK